MRIIGCDLQARQQTLAMLDSTTGEVVKATLQHEGNDVREFYSKLPRPARVGIEATGSMQWFVNLMEELGIECLVGNTKLMNARAERLRVTRRNDSLGNRRNPCVDKEVCSIRGMSIPKSSCNSRRR